MTTVLHDAGAGFARLVRLDVRGMDTIGFEPNVSLAKGVVGCTTSMKSIRSDGIEAVKVRIRRPPVSMCTKYSYRALRSMFAFSTGVVKVNQSSKAPPSLMSVIPFSESQLVTAVAASEVGALNALTYATINK